VLCNSPAELDLLTEFGTPAAVMNHNIFVDTRVFGPLPDESKNYEAVSVARMTPWKRQILACELRSVAHVSVREASLPWEETLAYFQQMQRAMPSHSFLNPIEGERFRPLAPAEVNVVLNRARVGLCLSAAEGAMFANMEYMLAGLPVVSTPNLGGRDFFFDPDYCLTVPANAGAVRAAVESLVARNIPASYIRSRTLARAERERGHFIELLRQAGRHRAPSVGREGPGRLLRRLLSLVPAGGAPARHPFRGLSKPPFDQPPASSASLAGSRNTPPRRSRRRRA
jgi:glycosyltransferase involved in cell wall biosynthesis